MFVRILLLLAACLTAGSALADEHERYATILIINETPEFKVIPTIEIFESAPQAFNETSQGKFECRFKTSKEKWFNPADIKLVWKDAFQKNDHSKSDFQQRVVLRLRYNFPDQFPVHVYFSNKRSQDEMFRLEHQMGQNQQWENFFRGWQIAAYYRETNGLEHPLSRRASRIFFNAAVQLAEYEGYFVVMSDDAITFEEESGDKRRDLSKAIDRAKSAYWEDLERIYKENDCTAARMLLTDLEKAKRNEPELFKLRYPTKPQALGYAEQHVDSKCPQADVERP